MWKLNVTPNKNTSRISRIILMKFKKLILRCIPKKIKNHAYITKSTIKKVDHRKPYKN